VKVLGVAVWGLGQHAINRIIPALTSINEVSLVGVCSRDTLSVSVCSKRLNCAGWTDEDEMLRSSEVDVVCISTPIGIHAKQAKKIIEAGKNVWCEKPLTCNYNDTKYLVDLARKSNKILSEGLMYLHHPQFKKLEDFISNELNGHVHSVVCRFGIPDLDKPGFRNNPKLCGGAFWDLAVYTVSAALALFPNQEVKVLYSEIISKENSNVDTSGRALLKFSKGTLVFLEWAVGVSYKNEIDLWSENKSIYTDKIFSKPEEYLPLFHIRDKQGKEVIENGEKSEQFIDMFRNYYSMFHSPIKLNQEFENILFRSRVMDEIFHFTDIGYE